MKAIEHLKQLGYSSKAIDDSLKNMGMEGNYGHGN
jgi:hypothetical protein